MAPHVDLALVFRGSTNSLLKGELREDSQQAEQQYTRLLQTLKGAGLYATGRRGEKQGQLLVLISCPQSTLSTLVQRERYSDFLHGLSTSNLSSVADQSAAEKLSSADRIRIIHSYVTSMPQDGGLGIIPGSKEWSRVESIMALHDHDFNHAWIRQWSSHQVGDAQLDRIREQFGEAVALYFSFLHTYTHFLIFPAAIGVLFYFLGAPYSLAYSILLVVWSTAFVEYWRVRERRLSVRWSTRGSFNVEKRRADYQPNFPWWKRDLRAVASVPVILLFAGVLASLLTGIFVFEAFVTQIYTGPGHQYISLAPTVLFVALVPRVLGLYHALAARFTQWENHAHQSTHQASLTLKTFSLSAIVAYLGLALSAFVYVPFGGEVMGHVHTYLFHKAHEPASSATHAAASAYASVAQGEPQNVAFNTTRSAKDALDHGLWEADAVRARGKLNPSRLQDQMFAYMVTNQVINLFLEVGLPFVMRFVGKVTSGGAKKDKDAGVGGKKKRVIFEDETKSEGEEGKEERALLERVRSEVALPEYELFGDYSEMVTQFGYVVLWSTIWPLAPVMSLLNNWLELRSDAYKITVHQRRPIPVRTDTIGPWVDSLTFLTWLGALTNAALVYLFHGSSAPSASGKETLRTSLREEHPHTEEVVGQPVRTARQLLLGAAVVALAASHGYFLVRWAVRHLVEKVSWSGSREVEAAREGDRTVKENYLSSLGVKPADEKPTLGGVDGIEQVPGTKENVNGLDAAGEVFWEGDEGLEEIRRAAKDE
ncbi:DUF590-domain-containing protein [Punctularia strigosozonata HHB-11173 SS5]|uniref:DUF590-domain-containing protein n=1 Tax=Punctularia strigosozonata (strain HHB-11173) TaxID=741275 RepID=UPI00044176BC|nr:DUF590-domain-containing protein [Punctularia strigosozonata HHB-11173 SS5]EIN09636.1 DUF590-domain-containing protein [Punctularia strigosozonata HHB-11173 SS5]